MNKEETKEYYRKRYLANKENMLLIIKLGKTRIKKK